MFRSFIPSVVTSFVGDDEKKVFIDLKPGDFRAQSEAAGRLRQRSKRGPL